jgi:predicted RNase H-like HicB family nuclease
MAVASEEISIETFKEVAQRFEKQLEQMQPLLKQMHLLSSNAVSAAARAGSEGDAFKVLTQAIQQLRLEINTDMQEVSVYLSALLKTEEYSQAPELIKKMDTTLGTMFQSLRNGEYMAICCEVEAAHTETHGESFESVAMMLKQLIESLRQQVALQQEAMAELLELT